jgi:hypothetical protein
MSPLRARKVGGNYQAEGWVVSRFFTRAGKERVVFEFEAIPGMLHIFSPEQVEFVQETAPGVFDDLPNDHGQF